MSIVNFWNKEELEIISNNIDSSLSTLHKLLLKSGYDRSYDAIRKQKKRLLKKVITALDSYSDFIISKSNVVSRVLEEKGLEERYGSKKSIFVEKTVLVIPDAHVTNNTDLSRFDYVSSLIEERQPDIILIGGDFADMLSLSAWEKSNKLAVEGRRLKLEIDAVNEALDRLLSFKKKLPNYKPRMIYLEANHEFRISRYIEANPTLQGIFGTELSFKLKERGFEFVPYKEVIEIDGILYCHVPLLANALPLSGKYAAQKAADLVNKSLVFFHTHTMAQYFHKRFGSDELIHIYNAGNLFEGSPVGGYSDGSSHADTPAISILTVYKPSCFDIEQISLDRLIARYKE